MTDPVRYPESFASADGGISYAFPGDGLEWSPSQGFRRSEAAAIGADYAWDHLQGAAWPAAVAEEAVRFVIWGDTAADVDTAFDTCVATLRRIGRGKLWTTDAAGVRRWAWAKLAARPVTTVTVDALFTLPVECIFARYSNWYAESPTTGSQALSASPTTWNITNPGTAPARGIVLRLRSNGATGATDPKFENLTNSHEIQTTRDLTGADHELRIDNGAQRVQRSTDDGATYADDWALVTVPADQVALLELEPGINSIRYTDAGTPDAVAEWSFYPEFY